MQERWILGIAALFCAALDFYLLFKRSDPPEPKGERLSRLIGSNFFLLYFAHRLALRLRYSVGEAAHWTSWLDWALNVSPFLIFALSYLIRVPASSKALGLRERLFPFFCLLLPVGVYESEALGSILSGFAPSFMGGFFRRFPIVPFGPWKLASDALIVLGNALTVWGLISLRKSFSIMAEVRELVRRGPYRRIRHPVYLGESLATSGWFILHPSGLSLTLTLLFIFCQRLRAHFEELKLESVFPEYADYRKRTGAYLPFRNSTL